MRRLACTCVYSLCTDEATAKKLAAYVRDRGGTVALGDLEVPAAAGCSS